MAVFAVGVALIAFSEVTNKHHVLSVTLGDAGSLLAGSIALAVLYDRVLKPTENQEILDLVHAGIAARVEQLLVQEHEETARSLSRISDLLSRVADTQDALLSHDVRPIIPTGALLGGFRGVLPRHEFEDIFSNVVFEDEILCLNTFYHVSLKKDALFQAVRAGVAVKMLAMRPGAANCVYRAQEIGFSETMFRNEAQSGLDSLREVAARQEEHLARGTLEVRLYDGLPCVPMYLRIRAGKPTKGYTGFFLDTETVHEPQIVWGSEQPNGFLERFEKYFRQRWDLAGRASTAPYLEWPRSLSSAANRQTSRP